MKFLSKIKDLIFRKEPSVHVLNNNDLEKWYYSRVGSNRWLKGEYYRWLRYRATIGEITKFK